MKRFKAEQVKKLIKSNNTRVGLSTCVAVGGGGRFRAYSARI